MIWKCLCELESPPDWLEERRKWGDFMGEDVIILLYREGELIYKTYIGIKYIDILMLSLKSTVNLHFKFVLWIRGGSNVV